MNAFIKKHEYNYIKKHEYNYIKKCLKDLNNTFRNCVDINIIEATKAYLYEKILRLFTNLSEEEKELLDISKINDPLQIDNYLSALNEYVYGMPEITNAQISKLFKKEKKLKLPTPNAQDSKNVYLGWIDESIRKLFVVYNMNDKLIGMACRIQNYNSNSTHICALCNHVGQQNEVAFVSPICKTGNTKDGYRSIGFDICLDSAKCNERIVSVEKLEKILKDVNNIK
ncbi:FusB/FusC family EF-G-binding protein [Clostridium sp. ZS2-4]|uniref:FusB/FusC family EF-G-binding protein n=1 Tax=Clostridium sp. ZS2-4 TaxID=2987703 RepID=UPI00227A0607|nr:FusB/FusC family EF-G-binding protein [Clostridium sp. ZS2-4]MCY6354226.1 FusB/FusC family EF-G-binding protein [Clostridium sp. ZS2-4]